MSTTIKSQDSSNSFTLQNILKDGNYYILDKFSTQKEVLALIESAMLDGIKQLADNNCYQSVCKSGLAKMHLYFPAKSLVDLERLVRDKISKSIIKMACEVGKNELLLEKEFFINSIILLRIKYPFKIAKNSKVSYEDYIYKLYSNEYRKDSFYAKSIRKGKSLVSNIRNYISSFLNKKQTEAFTPKTVFEYNSKYPFAAFAHGPHLDSWFSAPYSLEFWLSVAGLREDNALLFYPETYGANIECMEGVPFINPGVELPKPSRVAPPNGSLIIFNGELLHGTQLNVSDETRIGVSVNVSPHELYFSPDRVAGYNNHTFHSSVNISREDYENPVQFKVSQDNVIPRCNFCGKENDYAERNLTKDISEIVINLSSHDSSIKLCNASEISTNQKVLFCINFANSVLKVLLVKHGDNLYAISPFCPHLGTPLVDAFHDSSHIYCPGHGLTFSLKDGFCEEKLFRLSVYEVVEEDGTVVLKINKNR
jgi:nitrite reductase/ring-hydroxylating ferredoxin subunit